MPRGGVPPCTVSEKLGAWWFLCVPVGQRSRFWARFRNRAYGRCCLVTTLEVDVMKRVLNVLLVVVLMAAVSTAPSGATQIDGPGYPSGTEAKLACTAAYLGLDAAADLPRTSVAIVHFLLSVRDRKSVV